MPRAARIDAPGALHHIICRGFERRSVFRDDEDRKNFVDRLSRIVTESNTACCAWTLVPNHFHLLFRTGDVPIATVMRRLLTGYAVSFNKRHKRHGRLFQNRYKSILCQEERYLLELVRYIHLNPLRANLVPDMQTLDSYPYCGHSVLMGNLQATWQDSDHILSLFSRSTIAAQRHYRDFMDKGISQGRRPELTGGGLLRSAGGWGAVKTMRRKKAHLKGDERILGDSSFVKAVLDQSREYYDRRYRLKTQGYTLDGVIQRTSELFNIPVKAIVAGGKQPDRVKARSLAAYWAVRELGLNGTLVGRKIGLSQSAVSRAVQRGEKLSEDPSFALPPEFHGQHGADGPGEADDQ